MKSCKRCGSYAINNKEHGRDGEDAHLCDVCYWRKRAEKWDEKLKTQGEVGRSNPQTRPRPGLQLESISQAASAGAKP